MSNLQEAARNLRTLLCGSVIYGGPVAYAAQQLLVAVETMEDGPLCDALAKARTDRDTAINRARSAEADYRNLKAEWDEFRADAYRVGSQNIELSQQIGKAAVVEMDLRDAIKGLKADLALVKAQRGNICDQRSAAQEEVARLSDRLRASYDEQIAAIRQRDEARNRAQAWEKEAVARGCRQFAEPVPLIAAEYSPECPLSESDKIRRTIEKRQALHSIAETLPWNARVLIEIPH